MCKKTTVQNIEVAAKIDTYAKSFETPVTSSWRKGKACCIQVH